MYSIPDILKKCGFPEDFVVIDFESYFDSEYTLRTLQPWEYITDPRFECLGCGFFYNLANSVRVKEYVWPDRLADNFRAMQQRYGEHLEDITVVIQNAQFDLVVMKHIYGITAKFTIDVKHLSAHQDSKAYANDLKRLCQKYGIGCKGETLDFKGLHLWQMSNEQRNKLVEYCKNDCDMEAKLFEVLLPRLSWPDMELWIARHTTGLYLNPTIIFNKPLADRLREEMTVELGRIIDRTGFPLKKISGSKSIIELFLKVLPSDEALPMKQGKPTKNGTPNIIPALAKNDDGCNYLLAHPDEKVANLMEARLAVKSWPNHLKRIDKMESFANAAGALPVPLNYYGSHTGRMSGGGKINLCNLGGSGRAGAENHPLIKAMRGLLVAPPGFIFALDDSAQIECRFLAWIAGCKKLVTGFANKEDVYSVFATELFGEEVRKPKKGDFPTVAQRLEIMRGFGKDGILGSGYGMGADKFHTRCLENKMLRPLFDSKQYDFFFIKKLINTYRRTYVEIPAFWGRLEKMFRWVVKYPHEHVLYGIKEGFKSDLLQMWNDRGNVNVQLPSGRILFYPHASISKDGYDLRYEHGHLWGGTLTENIVQAACRDLLMVWLRECEEHGRPIVHHVYDELIAMVPVETCEADLAYINTVMERAPSWAEGCPLGAEGKLSLVYTK